ncbi:hypothetical protein BC936DRAFT_143173 [Jimgerdemannia flammicorona]|uniref:Uncharacterized protein n=1 Tax=Jimgerdemannia flammicorona TaxID=994334 RepID=A0A432ZZ79_9FUNG|nr:hypothetical protein BC936DRAFT_143173 [Jimgerdemannia flammicorona]
MRRPVVSLRPSSRMLSVMLSPILSMPNVRLLCLLTSCTR